MFTTTVSPSAGSGRAYLGSLLTHVLLVSLLTTVRVAVPLAPERKHVAVLLTAPLTTTTMRPSVRPRTKPVPEPPVVWTSRPIRAAVRAPEFALPDRPALRMEPPPVAIPLPLAVAPPVPPPATVPTDVFAGVPAVAALARRADTLTGVFETASGDAAQPASGRPAVSSAGFSQAEAAQPRGRPGGGGRIGAAGFGQDEKATPAAPRRAAVVRAALPEVAPAVEEARPRSRDAESVFSGVEILFKPQPAYTEQARQRQVEGEVLLEALFTGDGEVRVLRVVRGLGYGLDENAVLAVRSIRFKPATRNGRPVDSAATVRITFQLAY